ncbi:ATP-dependent DNA ligase [Streptomyces sp. NBC_01217]|uniref:ATP-dependent DNA ligase n=1 Tax=Streptomyces sp. NBC_01217 TaxID=2903779 RepID=UPI002E0F0E17|nr:hypothetical protein OG507_40135 [Streptomyces sp. NBC_01217]
MVGGRLSFEALQRRASSGGRTAHQLAEAMPAHFIAFDVLQIDAQELLTEPYEHRRAVLEGLFTDHGLTAPWTLCPTTTDPAIAKELMTSWTDVSGVEGLVIKGLGQRSRPGVRGWFKILYPGDDPAERIPASREPSTLTASSYGTHTLVHR